MNISRDYLVFYPKKLAEKRNKCNEMSRFFILEVVLRFRRMEGSLSGRKIIRYWY